MISRGLPRKNQPGRCTELNVDWRHRIDHVAWDRVRGQLFLRVITSPANDARSLTLARICASRISSPPTRRRTPARSRERDPRSHRRARPDADPLGKPGPRPPRGAARSLEVLVARMERLVRHSSKSDGGSVYPGPACPLAPIRVSLRSPGLRHTVPVSPSVNPHPQKYSTLPKFGFGVCVAHPGSPRGAT